jgi:trehalose 6-phosphate synthase/phosphatase
MNRLFFVSNRLPATVRRKRGKLLFDQSLGGLATGLGSFYKSFGGKWVGWCGIPSNKISQPEKEKIKIQLQREFSSYPVFLSKRQVETYYREFCNRTLWPLLHGFTQYVKYDKISWGTYKEVNQIFAKTVLEKTENEDIVWIHDYHLMLLPHLLKKKKPRLRIGFFLHTPFPNSDVFRQLPWRKELLQGILASDLTGFHTYNYVNNFLTTVRRLLGFTHQLGKIISNHHLVKVDSFPMGIDYQRFAEAETRPKVQKNLKKLKKELGKKVIFSIDRLDYTKGILHRLKGFDLFLQKYPKFKKEVIFVLVIVPSRTKVKNYQILKKNVDELIGKINGAHGTIGWTPIKYIYHSLPFHYLLALYRLSDVAMVTPLIDGMNLVAKEFIATKTDGKGVLILSEMAGAVEELREALVVNPNSSDEIANALARAFSLPEIEQVRRNRVMQERLKDYNIEAWASDFIYSLCQIKEEQDELSTQEVDEETSNRIVEEYLGSKNRLFLLDYDGTLVPFATDPKQARPDDELKKLLAKLSSSPKNEVVIISGRNKEVLEKFFKNSKIGLVAEHGGWIRNRKGEWNPTGYFSTDWKEQIRPIFQRHKQRTPGSMIEEKDFSLVWHYRKVDPELASVRAAELKETLFFLVANLELEVAEGNKIIEVKNAGINKGQAADSLLSHGKWNFILAIGDDLTDEDLFKILPDSAFSAKVGVSPSKAKYRLHSYLEVRSLLKKLVKSENQD